MANPAILTQLKSAGTDDQYVRIIGFQGGKQDFQQDVDQTNLASISPHPRGYQVGMRFHRLVPAVRGGLMSSKIGWQSFPVVLPREHSLAFSSSSTSSDRGRVSASSTFVDQSSCNARRVPTRLVRKSLWSHRMLQSSCSPSHAPVRRLPVVPVCVSTRSSAGACDSPSSCSPVMQRQHAVKRQGSQS